MKLLPNGGLNLSELDGWWAEAYTKEVGWALGDGKEHGDDASWDVAEAETLYTILEQQVAPLYYKRNGDGLPTEWIKMIRSSMLKLAPEFSTVRMMKEYVEKYYHPLAKNYTARNAAKGQFGIEIEDMRQFIRDSWKSVQFLDMQVLEKERQGQLRRYSIDLKVRLGDIAVKDVLVELYAAPNNGSEPVHIEMKCLKTFDAVHGEYLYQAQVVTGRAISDFTPRIIPHHLGLQVPREAPEILWQH
jgi:starch phosphorylase